jgi:hypothetical protein
MLAMDIPLAAMTGLVMAEAGAHILEKRTLTETIFEARGRDVYGDIFCADWSSAGTGSSAERKTWCGRPIYSSLF